MGSLQPLCALILFRNIGVSRKKNHKLSVNLTVSEALQGPRVMLSK